MTTYRVKAEEPYSTRTFQMEPEVLAQWITDLESGEYLQGHGKLRTEQRGNFFWCCLGVLGDGLTDGHWVPRGFGYEWMPDNPEIVRSTNNGLLPAQIMGQSAQLFFAHLNDSRELSFVQIAKVLRNAQIVEE